MQRYKSIYFLLRAVNRKLGCSPGYLGSEDNSEEAGVVVADCVVASGKILLTRIPGMVKSCDIFSSG